LFIEVLASSKQRDFTSFSDVYRLLPSHAECPAQYPNMCRILSKYSVVEHLCFFSDDTELEQNKNHSLQHPKFVWDFVLPQFGGHYASFCRFSAMTENQSLNASATSYMRRVYFAAFLRFR